MKTSSMLAAAVVLALSTGAAQARETLAVRLQAPIAAQERVIADRMLFNCVGDQCAAVLRTKLSVRTCRELAKEVGPITAFGAGAQSLTEEELTRCNEVAKQIELPQTVQASAD